MCGWDGGREGGCGWDGGKEVIGEGEGRKSIQKQFYKILMYLL